MANDYVKAKTQNKSQSKFKKGLGYFFKGLFSNKNVIEGANTNPWWVAFIFILFATFLPVIPITVSSANVKGSNFLGSSLNGLETKITYVTEDLQNNNKEFKVDEGKILHYYENGTQTDIILKDTVDEYLVSRYVGPTTNQIEFEVFYSSDNKVDLKSLKEKLNGDLHTYKLGTTDLKDSENDPEGTEYYIPSYILLNENELRVYLYEANSTKLSNYTNFASDWKSFVVGTELVKEALIVDPEITKGTLPYFQAIYKAWKGYVDKSYLSAKDKNVLLSSVIYLGVYFVLIFFMGLLVFLLTRGKKNPFSYMKLIDCIKIIGWASICPALLSLIFGFLLATYASMIFIVTMGMRTMWLCIRQFRPY